MAGAFEHITPFIAFQGNAFQIPSSTAPGIGYQKFDQNIKPTTVREGFRRKNLLLNKTLKKDRVTYF